MKWYKKALFLGALVPFAFLVTAYRQNQAGVDDGKQKDQAILQLTLQTLEATHFKPQTLDDSFSEKVFKLYIKRLDYGKKFLLQSDVEKLSRFEKQLDDEIRQTNFEMFDESVEIINKRIAEVESYYKELLEKPLDLKSGETIETDPDKLKFASSAEALKTEWNKYFKFQVMTRVADMQSIQEKAQEKKDTSVKVKTYTEMEADARSKVLKQYEDYFKNLNRLTRNDRVAMYVNCITNVYDPHTEFFPPKEKENFDISMTGQLEGIGAQLQEKDGNIKVTNIVPGSPSYRQGKLKAGDVIIKVGQGANEPDDVVGMRLDDVVRKIRGKKGTEVRLTVKKPDASIEVIPIIRDVVVFEDSYAKSAILENNGKRIGYIRLPSFYSPVGGNGNRYCSRDVKNELIKLKEENVQGVVLDLRNNGGGSLQDVVDMTGLFIERGPIVQVKNRQGVPQILSDSDPSVLYDGPLAVLVNTNSASASEILAAAIQDYKRGVIIGSPSTFGKGSVQRFVGLDDILNSSYSNLKPLGAVKVTIQKFYRINGATTQLKGVTPDIIIPDAYSYIDRGEKEQDYPLAWDEITKLDYETWKNPINYDAVAKNAQKKMKADESYKLIDENAHRIKVQSDKTSYTINVDKYRQEQKSTTEENKKYESLSSEINTLTVKNLKLDMEEISADSVKVARNKDWMTSLRKDHGLYESISVFDFLR